MSNSREVAQNSYVNVILLGRGAYRPLRGEQTIFRKDEHTLRRIDGKYDSVKVIKQEDH